MASGRGRRGTDTAVVLFGDDDGIPRLLRLLPPGTVRAVVRASIRPAQEEPLARLCSATGIPLLVQPRASATEYTAFVSELLRLAPDVIVVDSYSMLLQPDVLVIPSRGAFNVHGALLPAYRGANPIQWALLNDERETGVTIHLMTEAFDAGDIVAQRRVPIRFEDTWVDVLARIRQATGELLAEQLPRILDGTYDRRPQDSAAARHFRRRRPEDGSIDFGASVVEIYNLVRALVAPNPGASYRRGDEVVVVDRYLTVSEVAALKHGPSAERAPSGPTVRLVAQPGGNDLVELTAERLADGPAAGRAAIRDIDWDQRSARLEVATDADVMEEVHALAQDFAVSELALTDLADVHAASSSR
jgi:methionyl-tRNA formyltransferase